MTEQVTELAIDGLPAPDGILDAEQVAERISNAVGFTYRVPEPYLVGREKVREYARSVQDFHPAHHDSDAARELGYKDVVTPLTFISLVGILAQKRLFEEAMSGYGVATVLQSDQRVAFYKPIAAGDTMSCQVTLDSFRQMSGADIIVTRNDVYNQNEELTMTTWTTLVGRSGERASEELIELAEKVMAHGTA